MIRCRGTLLQWSNNRATFRENCTSQGSSSPAQVRAGTELLVGCAQAAQRGGNARPDVVKMGTDVLDCRSWGARFGVVWIQYRGAWGGRWQFRPRDRKSVV